jgi:hypothetical protein
MLQANTQLQKLTAPKWRARNHEFDERILADVIQPYFCHLPHARAFVQNRGPTYAKFSHWL